MNKIDIYAHLSSKIMIVEDMANPVELLDDTEYNRKLNINGKVIVAEVMDITGLNAASIGKKILEKSIGKKYFSFYRLLPEEKIIRFALF